MAGPGRDVSGKLISAVWDPWNEMHLQWDALRKRCIHAAQNRSLGPQACMKNVMRIAIVGCGLIGQKRAAALRALGHELVVVADTAPARAADLASRTGAETVSDWRMIAARTDLDAVIVATSHDWLSPIAVACLNAGQHVLVEKPAGRNLGEAQAIAAAAASTSGSPRSASITASIPPCCKRAPSSTPARSDP